MRQCHADIECLVCHKPIKMKFPKSANCTHCGAVYTIEHSAKVTNTNLNDLVVIQKTKITSKGHSTEETIQWTL